MNTFRQLHRNRIKDIFVRTIGFLKWAELDQEDVRALSHHEPLTPARVFLSPDVHSLHIVWWYNDPEDEPMQEIADYPETAGVRGFLDEEVFDDAEGPIQGMKLEELLGDFRGDPQIVPIVTIAQLEEAALVAGKA